MVPKHPAAKGHPPVREMAMHVRRRFLPLVGALLGAGALVLASGPGAGSPGATTPIVESTHRAGYVMAARDGGIFNFGGAGFHGAVTQSDSATVGVASRPSLDGYWT